MIGIWLYMTRLYTRLVTYARLHILTLVVFFYHDTSYTSFIALLLILIILLSFISVYHVIIAYVVIMHEHLSLYTHSLGRFWRPWIHTSRIFGHLLMLFRCSCDRTLREESEFLSFWFWYSCLFLFLFLYFSWFMYIRFSFYSSSFYMISCVDAYMWYCSDRWFMMV